MNAVGLLVVVGDIFRKTPVFFITSPSPFFFLFIRTLCLISFGTAEVDGFWLVSDFGAKVSSIKSKVISNYDWNCSKSILKEILL